MTVSVGYLLLYVPDVPATLEFYTEAFGFEVRFVTDEGDYGELNTGAVTLGFVSHELARSNLDDAGGFTALDAGPSPVGSVVTLVTDDVPAGVAAAEAAGATRYTDPAVKPWGQTVAYLVDPNGALIELATPMG